MPALFESFVMTWLAVVATVTLKGSAYVQYESICRRHLIPAFGDAPIEAITTEKVQEYLADKVKCGLSPRTVRNHFEVLRRVMAYAIACGLVAQDPTRDAVLPRFERLEMTFLTPDGLRRLIESTPKSWRLLTAMAALTGLRKGEQLALKFTDIDFSRRTITVSRSMRDGQTSSCKTATSVGVIPLPESLIPMLRERREKVADPEGLIFCRANGSPLPDGLPNAVLASALSVAGLPPMRWHDLRHSWVVSHLQAGTSISQLVRLGRWKSADVLLSTYAHVLPAEAGDAVRKMEQLVD